LFSFAHGISSDIAGPCRPPRRAVHRPRSVSVLKIHLGEIPSPYPFVWFKNLTNPWPIGPDLSSPARFRRRRPWRRRALPLSPAEAPLLPCPHSIAAADSRSDGHKPSVPVRPTSLQINPWLFDKESSAGYSPYIQVPGRFIKRIIDLFLFRIHFILFTVSPLYSFDHIFSKFCPN
jgi:hypothetical protein